MLKTLTIFFQEFISVETSSEEEKAHALNLAIAAILVEVGAIDNQLETQEEQTIKAILEDKLDLSQTEIEQLKQLAADELKDATDYYQFTSLINQHFDQPQRVAIIENLWQVAYADGKLDSHEEHFIRKIADLLFVPHSAYIKTKLKTNPSAN